VTALPWLVVFWLGGLAGCTVAAADHERLGDEAFRERSFAKALSEYQAAQQTGARSRVWAKIAAAAIEVEEYGAAIEAFDRLAQEDPTRAAEAAVGLERVAQLVERGGPSGYPTIATAIAALRRVAPTRPLGRLALVSMGAAVEPRDAVTLIPTAMATAGSPRAVDSLLLRLAEAQRITVACDGAASSYRTVLRRTDDPKIRSAARDGLADCALILGQDALSSRDDTAAESWFALVVQFEPETVRGWRANVGVGDARLLRGDALGAAVAYQAVLSAVGVPDSLREAAAAKLNSLGAAPPPPPTEGAP
jgi:tetratricopeptide (TPR) repeat protein